MNTEQVSTFEKLNNFIRSSVTLKLITITLLMLLLLIPASMIQSVIHERESLSQHTITDVSSNWANNQQLTGPVLSIPLIYEYVEDGKTITYIDYWHSLPAYLEIDGNVEPKVLKRGIYEVVVYESELNVSGTFSITPEVDPKNLKEIQYPNAFLTLGISDLRGIKNQIDFKWNNESAEIKPGSRLSDLIYSGVTIELPKLEQIENSTAAFSFVLDLQGSQNLSFIPTGSTTEVSLKSSWKSPSFNGNFLPDTRDLNEDGFTASWTILQLNRNYPQSWTGKTNDTKIKDSSFGVDLILPMDDYQKSYRSIQYSAMTIALTFLIFFLVEVLNKRKIHPFQYALVGLALCLFYTLLVSISEHTNFNISYGISTLGIVCMVGLYSISIFKKRKLSVLLILTLVGIYGFLFVTLQLTDFALLLGSIGLVIILGATMYFTRNINWYKLNIGND